MKFPSFIRNDHGKLSVFGFDLKLLISIILATTTTGIFLFSYTRSDVKKLKDSDDDTDGTDKGDKTPKTTNSTPDTTPPPVSTTKSDAASTEKSDKVKAFHKQIEDADKRGKAFFKAKEYLKAAACFTEALDLIEESTPQSTTSSAAATLNPSVKRQVITLTNNRGAMYEKAEGGGSVYADLALVDCDRVLELDVGHSKARLRKLRILESCSRWNEALVVVCALQLRFMQDNRDKLRMGIPVQPPVPQSKIEDLMAHILPNEIEQTMKKLAEENKEETLRRLPSTYTILQLLKSFSGYNTWMSSAARGKSESACTKELAELDTNATEDAEKQTPEQIVARSKILYERGCRRAYEKRFELAIPDFEESYELVKELMSQPDTTTLEFDEYPKLLEWAGMGKHLRYDLDGASNCYEKCSDLDPTNAEILVKRAGVKMDGGNYDDAIQLFESALTLDPSTADALLHRSNLYMLQSNGDAAKTDLESCIKLRPDFLLPRLRLATVLMGNNDLDGAKTILAHCERMDPQSSEVHSYLGEMYFSEGNLTDAKESFDTAIKLEPGNPTPYVNAALAVMNTPGVTGGPPDVASAMELLESAIKVDPMFHAAYVHLGQLKLSMAVNLSMASEVIALYDKGIKECRSPEELKDICSMRVLTVAQVEAGNALGMETINMA